MKIDIQLRIVTLIATLGVISVVPNLASAKQKICRPIEVCSTTAIGVRVCEQKGFICYHLDDGGKVMDITVEKVVADGGGSTTNEGQAPTDTNRCECLGCVISQQEGDSSVVCPGESCKCVAEAPGVRRPIKAFRIMK